MLRFLLFLTIMGMMTCQCSREKSVPVELIGVWITSDPRYEGCSIEITPMKLIYRNPRTEPGINRIRGIEKTPEGARILYRIYYEDQEGDERTVSLYHCRKNHEPVIRFQHREEREWRKKE
ncbi:MAG: hypothetical protein JXL84_11870 [Deltaproteobacteria bacterium]|nr:hypothetical protein [Deltaproteobacteria bacterium]